ncbi:DoxX family protein [uncultured Roseobacter sp.]|uniref:DoxX family protein n=1 Tax=uncultured Roseobacter sp. TaxID=114847 RepID=UPI002633A6D1|nr:DoxX family protein [uncultured Roseobacter sp.]
MISFYHWVTDRLSRLDWLIPTMARVVFAGTLLMYFWVSGLTKLGEGFAGLFQPSVGAYAQIFPKAMEAVTYDTSQLSLCHWAVTVLGTWAEFILPALIVIGLFTRVSALCMIAFVGIQSATDLYGHGGLEHKETYGAWFDRFADSAIMDQRSFWVFLLLVLVIKGAGPLSLDTALRRSRPAMPSHHA